MSPFDPLAALEGAVGNLAAGVISNVQKALSNVEDAFNKNVLAPTVSVVESGITGIENGLGDIYNTATSAISNTIGKVSSGLSTLASDAASGLSTVLGNVASGIENVGGNIIKGFENVVGDIGTVLNNIKDAVFAGLGEVGKDIGAGFAAVAHDVFGPIEPIIVNIEKFLGEIPGDLLNFGKDIVAGIEKIPVVVGDVVKTIENFLNPDYRNGLIAKASVGAINEATKFLTGLVTPLVGDILAAGGFGADNVTGDTYRKIVEVAAAETAVGALTELSPSIAFVISNLLKSVTDALLLGSYRNLEQSGNISNPNKLVDAGSMISLFLRGKIDGATLEAELAKDGYSPESIVRLTDASQTLFGLSQIVDARLRGVITSDDEYLVRTAEIGVPGREAQDALKAAQQLFNPDTAINMWRRGIVVAGDTDQFDDLRRSGWTDARIKALKDTSYNLPDIFLSQDFKVRSVDDPDVVNKFQLDYGIDEEYFSAAQKLGWDRKTAQRIYRYYWEYPPFFQVKAMYEAGDLSEADFKDILKFLRFTPYWIDKLSKNLTPKLTKADVKEMYKYQVIHESQIVPELQKIGITGELATQLATLWINSVKLAAPVDQTGAQAAAEKIKGDTLGLVIKAYKDQIFSQQDVKDHLKQVGYTDDIISLELSIADYDTHSAMVKSKVQLYKEAYKAGTMSQNEIINALSSLGITADQLQLYTLEIQLLGTHKTTTPTKAEFISWFKKGIITLTQLVGGLGIIGYSDAWLPYILREAGATVDEIAALNFSIPTALSQF